MTSLAIRLFHFCALALAITPCKGNPMLLGEESTGSSARLGVGECLQVALHGNATTGFTWEVAPGAESVLAQQGETSFAADHGSVGAGGTYTFTFRALAPGATVLELVYRRPWEKEMAPLKTYQLRVTVGE